MPPECYFSHGFIYVEPTKNIYYPGEVIQLAVHLSLTQQLSHIDALVL